MERKMIKTKALIFQQKGRGKERHQRLARMFKDKHLIKQNLT